MIVRGAAPGKPESSRGAAAVLLALILATGLAGCGPAPGRRIGDDGPVVELVPFEVRGQEEGADYLGWAVAESMAINLAQAQHLRVVEPSPFVGAPHERSRESPGEAAPDVTRRITGTLTREGETIRADLELRDAISGDSLWKTDLTADGSDLSGLTFRLARRMAQALGVSYPELYEYVGDLTGGPEWVDLPLAVRARDALRRGDTTELLETSSELVERYPDIAAAHAFNAVALMQAWDADPSAESYLARLRERIAALDAVDPSSPYPEIIRGYVYRSSGQPEEARSLYSRVLARKELSNTARAWILRQRAFAQSQTGNTEAARADAQEAVDLDPANALSLAALSRALESAGRLDEAIARTQEALALQPSSWRQHQRLGLVYSRADMNDEAVRSLDRACRLGQRQEACANLAVTLQRMARETEARAAARFAESLAPSRWGSYDLACFWSLAGDRDRALEALERSLELGFADVLIDTDPDLEPLRGDPDYQAIVDSVAERIRSRRQLTTSVFPWQARTRVARTVLPA